MIKKVICKVTGHKLKSIQKDNFLIKEFSCKNCKKMFTIDGYGNLVELNKYWKKNNIVFEKYFQSNIL